MSSLTANSSMRNNRVGSVSLLQVHFSKNNFLGVRVRFYGIRVILRGKLRFYGRSEVLGFGEMVLEKWGTSYTNEIYHNNNISHWNPFRDNI